MWRLRRVLKWIMQHIYIKHKDLNEGEGKPHNAIEVGIKGSFLK